jgi:hypothetical protein
METFAHILDAWRTAERESDKRALWRTLARGGWLQACRDAVQRQDRLVLTTWLDVSNTTTQDIIQYNGPDAARMVDIHLRCSLAACGHEGQMLTQPSPGFCRDLVLLLSDASLRQAERTTTMTVLLVDTARNEGVTAVLTLELMSDGSGALYPAPELAFLRDADFQQAEANAGAAISAAGLWTPDTDVRWRLQRRDGKPLTSLSGPSLGAAFALGVSKLLTEQ